MNMLAEPIILMILPGCLVFFGMCSGFVLWSWTRGVDNRTLEELHDEIRRLSSHVKDHSGQAGLQDIQFENQELRLQCESVSDEQQETQQELEELKSVLKVFESESTLAETTIVDLRSRLEERGNQEAAGVQQSYRFVSKPMIRTDIAAKEDPAEDVGPTILRPSFDKASTHQNQPMEASAPLLDIAYGGRVRHDENLGLVYSMPPMINDNLQLISGIAQKLEQQLNTFGVFTFQQIMLWDEHNIDQFSSLLDTFQGRIERDDWVGQANVLYAKARSMRRAA